MLSKIEAPVDATSSVKRSFANEACVYVTGGICDCNWVMLEQLLREPFPRRILHLLLCAKDDPLSFSFSPPDRSKLQQNCCQRYSRPCVFPSSDDAEDWAECTGLYVYNSHLTALAPSPNFFTVFLFQVELLTSPAINVFLLVLTLCRLTSARPGKRTSASTSL